MFRKIFIAFAAVAALFLSQVSQVQSQEPPDQYLNFVGTAIKILEENFYDSSKLNKNYLYNSALFGASSAVTEATGKPCEYDRIPALMPSNMAKSYFEGQMARILNTAQNLGVDKQYVIFYATDNLLESVDDSHTYFLDPEQTENFQKMLNGGSGDLRAYGFFLAKIGNTVYMQEVIPGSPADKAGIKNFDQLIAINNKNVSQLPVEEILGVLKKTEMAIFTIRRGNKELTVVSGKAKVGFPSMKAQIIIDNNLRIGYVKLYIFSRELFAQLVALPVILGNDLDGIIVDVRGNHGGYVYVLGFLLEQFLKPGTTAYYTKNSQARVAVKTRRNPTFNCPLVVLTDGQSFSCSEIFASAIQENGRGVCIGDNTGGAVGYGQMFPLPFDCSMMVTVEQTLSKSGKNLEKTGVKPDIPLKQTYDDVLAQRDTLIEKAVTVIRDNVLPKEQVLIPPTRDSLLLRFGLN